MVGLWKHVVFVLPLVLQGLGQLCISDNSSETPEELCTLASPSLTFAKDGVTIDASQIGLDIPDRDSVWIGYVQVLQPFFYEGCAPEQYLKNISSHEIDANPGECYSYCNRHASYIGIPDLKCYCLDEDEIPDQHDMLTKQGCSSNCQSQSEVICGGSGYVSIYKPATLTGVRMEDDRLRRCLAVIPSQQRKIWTECIKTRRYMCKKDDSSILIINDKRRQWDNIMQLCARNGNLPVEVDSIPNDDHYDKKVWSGHVRSNHILKWNGSDDSVRGRRGYITNINGILKLNFTNEKHDRKALCICATTTSTRTSTPSSSKSPTSAYPSVVVFVLAPVVALLAIVVVVFIVCWRLRKTRAKDKNAIDKNSRDQKGKVGTNNAVINASYQDNDHIINSQATVEIRHEYVILEPAGADGARPAAEINNPADNQYDTTGAVTRRDIEHETGNVYNRLDDLTDDTYNHTNASSSRCDKTYNHIGSDGSGNTFTTTEKLSNSKKNIHTSEREKTELGRVDDTYNHIGNNSH